MRRPCTVTKSGLGSLELEKACAQRRRPDAAKNKSKKVIKTRKEKKEEGLPAWHWAGHAFVILTRMQTCWTGLAGWQCQPLGRDTPALSPFGLFVDECGKTQRLRS